MTDEPQPIDQPMRYLTRDDIIDLGLLQEINRLLLHRCGVALEIGSRAEQPDPTVKGGDRGEIVVRFWDYRDDPEGIHFADDVISAEKARSVEAMISASAGARTDLFGASTGMPGSLALDGVQSYPDEELFIPCRQIPCPDPETIEYDAIFQVDGGSTAGG